MRLYQRSVTRLSCSHFSNKTTAGVASVGQVPPLPDFTPAPELNAIPQHLRGRNSSGSNESSPAPPAATPATAAEAVTSSNSASASPAPPALPNPFEDGAGTIEYTDEEASLLFKALAKTSIDNVSQGTFGVNGIVYHGSILAFPNFCVLWKPKRWEDITPETLYLLELIKPKIDLLLLGSGNELRPLDPLTVAYLKKLGIATEIMKTSHAISTFSMLNDEDRRVACAAIAYEEGELEKEQDDYRSMMKTK